jgi:hypothetical protein
VTVIEAGLEEDDVGDFMEDEDGAASPGWEINFCLGGTGGHLLEGAGRDFQKDLGRGRAEGDRDFLSGAGSENDVGVGGGGDGRQNFRVSEGIEVGVKVGEGIDGWGLIG